MTWTIEKKKIITLACNCGPCPKEVRMIPWCQGYPQITWAQDCECATLFKAWSASVRTYMSPKPPSLLHQLNHKSYFNYVPNPYIDPCHETWHMWCHDSWLHAWQIWYVETKQYVDPAFLKRTTLTFRSWDACSTNK